LPTPRSGNGCCVAGQTTKNDGLPHGAYGRLTKLCGGGALYY
jgi:hypothetical protein